MPERIPNAATIRVPLQAYLSSDHVSAATGKTIAITISKNGGAYGNPSGGATNATEIASGSYYVDLSTTDTGTNGPLFVKGTEGTIDTIIAIYNVVNATNAGFTALPAVAAEAAGGLYTRGSGAGQINQSSNGTVDVNAVAISGDTTAADNAELFFDGTGYPTAQNAIADALLDRSAGIETGFTPRQAARIILASQGAKVSGAATTTVTIRDVGDTKDRIVATVDADGNRTAVTLDAT